jgi:hypothetical protein
LVTESPPTSINLERAAHKKLHTLVVFQCSWTNTDPPLLFPIPSGVFFLIDSFYAFL